MDCSRSATSCIGKAVVVNGMRVNPVSTPQITAGGWALCPAESE